MQYLRIHRVEFGGDWKRKNLHFRAAADIISKIILKGGFAVIMLRSNKRKTAPTFFAPVFDMVF